MNETLNEQSLNITPCLNEYDIALILGLIIYSLLVIAWGMSFIVQWSIDWIEDRPLSKKNWLGSKVSFKSKYKYRNYYSNSERIICYFLVLGIIAWLPMALLLMFKVYPLTLFVGVTALVMYLARFSRRTQKILLAHVADNEAHKNQQKDKTNEMR